MRGGIGRRRHFARRKEVPRWVHGRKARREWKATLACHAAVDRARRRPDDALPMLLTDDEESDDDEYEQATETMEQPLPTPPPPPTSSQYREGAYVPGAAPLPMWDRLQPQERRRLYVSPDRREIHFAVAARKTHAYHHSKRDFVVVGFRFAECSDGDILLGWCNSERGCKGEEPHRRDCYGYPGTHFRERTVSQVRQNALFRGHEY